MHSLLFALVLLFLIFLGKCRGEVVRLWLFMTPLLCVVVAQGITRRFPNNKARVLALVAALQFVTIVFIKVFQDF